MITSSYLKRTSQLHKIDKENESELTDEESLDKIDLYLLATFNTILNVKANGFMNKEIVILTRKKAQGTAIANYLTQHGIPILSSESLLINSSSEVQFIIHFLSYLNNNNDLQSKASFLYYLAKKNTKNLPIHDFITQGMAFVNESEFQDWLSTFQIDLNFEFLRFGS